MRLQVREQGDEVHIEVSGVAGRHQRVLQALTECSRGVCLSGETSLHPQDVSVRAGADEIRIRLKGRGGLRFEPIAIYRCMRHALIEERGAPMGVVAAVPAA
ncbi:MAG TPA: hypothetical protein VNW98_07270 [Burkholderiaceae bacterium]|jgi:hypothetical protein|nr:hypothetical protein [Burkholderiaceae bacterium]